MLKPNQGSAPGRRAWFSGGLGLALLLLSLVPIFDLGQGSAGAKAGVFVLLLALAAGAVWAAAAHAERLEQALYLAVPIGLAFFLRAMFLDHQSGDYLDFLSQWVAVFRENGGFAAMKMPIGNYNAPYLYFLALISYIPISDLYLIKLISMFFDVALAWGGLRLVRRLCPGQSLRPLLCFCVLLLLPTVILNGACWAQCDSLYGALVLHALASALEGKGWSSTVVLGVAFSFKLQTIFLVPLWGVLWLCGRLKFRQLFGFPAGYGAAILPALLLGKPLGDILGVYLGQTQEGLGILCYNASSIYSFLPYGFQGNERLGALLGIAAAFVLVLALLAAGFFLKNRMSDSVLLAAAVVMAVGVPFLLPYMHDRYFFLADVLAAVWACASPWHAPCAAAVQLSSLMAYLNYLRGRYSLVLHLGGQTFVMLAEALLMLSALIWSVSALFAGLRPETGTSEHKEKNS